MKIRGFKIAITEMLRIIANLVLQFISEYVYFFLLKGQIYTPIHILARELFSLITSVNWIFSLKTMKALHVFMFWYAYFIHASAKFFEELFWRVPSNIFSRIISFNPFVPNAPFLYPWKQKTVRFSDVFRG